MRWVSSKESVAKGEVSVLAIVETLCAIALVFYLSSHFNTLRWLAIAMCVAPLLLLRTEESTRLGIEWFDKWRQRAWCYAVKMDAIGGRLNAFKATVVFILGSAVAVFSIRILATLWTCFRKPISAVHAIPGNWSRVAFSFDFCFPPELIPEHPKANFDSVKRGFRIQGVTQIISLLLGPLFLPAFLYRWSLKATSIIYAPLVFVAYSTFSEGKDLRTKLELIRRGDLSRIRVLYGFFIVIVPFIVKLVLMAKWNGFAAWWNGNPITEFLAIYVAPAEIPKWQLAQLANSLLAIGYIFFARRALLGYELQHPWPETRVKRILGFVSGLCRILAIYTIVCTFYIFMHEASHWNLPALGEKWVPWQQASH